MVIHAWPKMDTFLRLKGVFDGNYPFWGVFDYEFIGHFCIGPSFRFASAFQVATAKAYCVDSKLDMCSTFRHLDAALATDKFSWALCLSFASKKFFIQKILEKFFTYTRHNIPMGNATEPAAPMTAAEEGEQREKKNDFFRGAARCWQPFTLNRVDIMSIQMTRTLNESVFAL